MGDQIPLANVIRVFRDESRGLFVARIGPRAQAVEWAAPTPELAMHGLARHLAARGWWWDGEWVDNLE